jgi:hypothetical protein
LFKFQSVTGTIVFQHGGLLGWLSKRQERMSFSSCEAKIWAKSATTKKIINIQNLYQSVLESGYPIADIDKPTALNNDNEACVRWSHNMTSKALHHIEH